MLVLVAALSCAALPIYAQGSNVADNSAAAADNSSTTSAKTAEAQDPQNLTPDPPPTEHPNPLEDARDRIYYPGDTERFKPLMIKLGGNILLDQKEIWTSPFHMKASNAGWWLGFGAVTAALIATDHQTSTWLENSKGQVQWGNNLSKIGTSYTLLPLLAGFYGFGVFRDDPKAREVAILGTEALVDSLIVVSVLKPIAGRGRPNATGEKGQFFDGGASFPSGHAASSWAVASIISYEYGHTKLVPIIAVGLAGVVSAARFTAQQHYASDIVAGGAIGWFIGRYVWKTHQDHAIHPHGRLNSAHITPMVQPSSGTYALALTWN